MVPIRVGTLSRRRTRFRLRVLDPAITLRGPGRKFSYRPLDQRTKTAIEVWFGCTVWQEERFQRLENASRVLLRSPKNIHNLRIWVMLPTKIEN